MQQEFDCPLTLSVICLCFSEGLTLRLLPYKPSMGGQCREISGLRLNKCLASICQTLGLYAQGLIISLAAYCGYVVLAYILQGIGFWQNMAGFDAGFVVAALLSLLSPLYVVVLPVMAKVRGLHTHDTSTCSTIASGPSASGA